MDKLFGLIVVGFLIFIVGVSVVFSSRLVKDDTKLVTNMIMGGSVTLGIGVIMILYGIFKNRHTEYDMKYSTVKTM